MVAAAAATGCAPPGVVVVVAFPHLRRFLTLVVDVDDDEG